MITNKEKVLLVLEGTYPFNGGGVSTWSHMLCNRVSNVDFILYSINANFETVFKYELSDNVKEVIQVPLWAPQEPHDYINYGKPYYKLVNRKELTNEATVTKLFIPVFRELIQNIYQKDTDVVRLDETIHKMWLFFNKYDYKETMNSQSVWTAFCEEIHKVLEHEEAKEATIYDLTIGMRWIYRFLMPIAIDIPEVSIAHITLSGFPIIPALVAKYKYDVPIIATEHGVFIRERLLAINSSEYSFFLKNMLISFSEAITRLAYHSADKILSVNEFNMKWELMYGANENKLDVIYNGIDHNIFKPAEKTLGESRVPTVVAAARIFDLKDIITMIKSCDVVRKKIPNVKYLIYGDNKAVPEYTAECERLIQELALQDNFILAGYHNKPHEIFLEGDISILTSISEGFPYTVIESMSCGTPVVATDVGGVSEALNEYCGFICKPKDHFDIANRVVQLLTDDELRAAMGRNARERIIENFTIETFIKKYEQVYASALANRTEGKPQDKILNLYKKEVKEAS